MNDLISVIVPVYNTAGFLEECLDSIMNQSYSNLEVILVDDGSTDRSGKICDDYSKLDKRIIVIHQNNAGVSTARNSALDIANGYFIVFVDSDDVLHPQYLEIMKDCIDDADIAICENRTFINDLDIPKYDSWAGVPDYPSKWDRIEKSYRFGVVWGKMFRRELISDLRFDSGLRQAEDALFLLNYYLKCKKVINIEIQLYYYRRRMDSATATIDEKGERDRLFVTSKVCDLLENEKKNCQNPNQIYNLTLLQVSTFYKYKQLGLQDGYNYFKKILKKDLAIILSADFKLMNIKEKIYLLYQLFISRK